MALVPHRTWHRAHGRPRLAGVALAAAAVALAACGCRDSRKQPSKSTQGGETAATKPTPSTSEATASAGIPANERAVIPGAIAFVSERGANRDVWLISPAGEQTRLTRGVEEEYPAALSRDGTKLLVVAAREVDGVHREQIQLLAMPADVSAAARAEVEAAAPLVAPSGRARNPSWAPDGAWVVFESDAHGFSDLVRIEPGGKTPPARLATAKAGNFEPHVSPDGARIAFASSREGNPEIYVMGADGGEVRRLTEVGAEDYAPQWSPDGRWIAFVSGREGRARAYVMRPDGTGVRAVSGAASTGDERDIAWSPDSRWLAFTGRLDQHTTRIFKAAVADGGDGGDVSDGSGGGDAVALTAGKGRDDQPAWSPDGRYVVFVSERTGDPELFLMRADGTGPTRLTTSPGADWLPRWAPSSPDTPAKPAKP